MRRSGNLAYLERSVEPSDEVKALSARLGGGKKKRPRVDEDNADLYMPAEEETAAVETKTRVARPVKRSRGPLEGETDTGPTLRDSNQSHPPRTRPPSTTLVVVEDSEPTQAKNIPPRKAPKEPNEFPNLEPSVHKVVVCKRSRVSGVVTQVKCSGWRIVRTLEGDELIRRPNQLEYADAETKAKFQPIVEELRALEARADAARAEAARRRRADAALNAQLRQQKQQREREEQVRRNREFPFGAQHGQQTTWQRPPGASYSVPSVGAGMALLDDGTEKTPVWRRAKVAGVSPSPSDDDDFVLRLQFEDGTFADEPWPPVADRRRGLFAASDSRVPRSIAEPPRDLVGRRFVTADGRVAWVVGYAKRADRDAALLLVQFQDNSPPSEIPAQDVRNHLLRGVGPSNDHNGGGERESSSDNFQGGAPVHPRRPGPSLGVDNIKKHPFFADPSLASRTLASMRPSASSPLGNGGGCPPREVATTRNLQTPAATAASSVSSAAVAAGGPQLAQSPVAQHPDGRASPEPHAAVSAGGAGVLPAASAPDPPSWNSLSLPE